MVGTKKYKLMAADGEGQQTCAFFASERGCRNGSKCKFLHGEPKSEMQTILDSSSVVSSESEDEIMEPNSPPTPPPVSNKKVSKSKRQTPPPVIMDDSSSDDEDIFAPVTKRSKTSDFKSTPSHEKKIKGKRNKGRDSMDSVSKTESPHPKKSKKTDPRNDSPPDSPISSPQKEGTRKNKKESSSLPSFLSLDLPVTSFSIPQNEGKIRKEESNENKIPFPTHSAAGKRWQKAITAGRVHKRYATDYDFPKYKQQETEKGTTEESDWIKAKPYGSWCKNNPQAIAIDCEMCETKCPKTGAIDSKALCRLSIINAEKPEQVLLDTLVKPDWPVKDYRTWVNGIEEKHLKDVEFTLEHAQKFLLALCSDETIIMGHALHNDLVSLRMEHQVVVDSAFLFEVKDLATAVPALRDLTVAMLGEEMPDTHDSVHDARMAFRCLEKWIEKDGNVEPIERTAPKKPQRSNRNASKELFIHRIPKLCKEKHISSMFLSHTSIQPTLVDDIDFGGNFGRGKVLFPSAAHCNLAFRSLDGDAEPDPTGRLQKKVFLNNGSYIRVRKMVHEREDSKDNETSQNPKVVDDSDESE